VFGKFRRKEENQGEIIRVKYVRDEKIEVQ
jgi:hypothetical protein